MEYNYRGRPIDYPPECLDFENGKAYTTRTVRIQQPFALSNKGGVITLVDDQGLKGHGVAYTKAHALNPGWTIVF